MFANLFYWVLRKNRVVIGAVAAVAFSPLATGQEPTSVPIEDRLLACDRMEKSNLRLECIEAVIGGLKSSANEAPVSATPQVVADTVDAEAPVVVIEAIPETSVAVVEAAVEAVPAVSMETNNGDAKPADLPALPTTATSSDFGLKDKEDEAARNAARVEKENKKKAAEQTVLATIVEVWAVRGGRFEARLDNGQVWSETEATRSRRLPAIGSSVRITSGRLGSFRMKVGNNNRLATVRRTQ